MGNRAVSTLSTGYRSSYIDRQGRAYIYFTVDEVKDRLHCANDKAVKLMRELGVDSMGKA